MMMFLKSTRPNPLYLRMECDQFQAQVIEAWHPGFRGKAFVVIEQNQHSHKTSVVSCSALARQLKIREGMPFQVIEKRHKNILSIARNRPWEKDTLEALRRLFDKWTPVFTISEWGSALLDLAGTPSARLFSAPDLANNLKEAIQKQIGLKEIAMGISSSRLVARMLARIARPDSIRYCKPGSEEAILAGMDASWLPGLSVKCRESLIKYGLIKISQIQKIDKKSMAEHFGSEGEKLYSLVRGFDFDAQKPGKNKINVKTILDMDINDEEQMIQKVVLTTDMFCFELKNSRLTTGHITLTLTYTDNRRTQKTIALPDATNDYRTMVSYTRDAFKALYQRRVAIQSITLASHQPQPDPGQLSLFETAVDRKQRLLGDAITLIRQKTNFSAINSCASAG